MRLDATASVIKHYTTRDNILAILDANRTTIDKCNRSKQSRQPVGLSTKTIYRMNKKEMTIGRIRACLLELEALGLVERIEYRHTYLWRLIE